MPGSLDATVRRKPLLLRMQQSFFAGLVKLGEITRLPLADVLMRAASFCFWPRLAARLGWAAAWQVLKKALITGETVTVRWPGLDRPLTLRGGSSDFFVFLQVFVFEQYGGVKSLQDVRFVVDAGAYVGYSALFFSQCFPQARVIAIEPDERNFACLRAHVAGHPRIHAVQAALWGTRQPLAVQNRDGDAWAFRVGACDAGEGSAVAGVTVGDILRQEGVSTIDVLKIDIEGAESEVFAAPDCDDWLRWVRLLVIELHDHVIPGSEKPFFEAVARHPYVARHAGDNLLLWRQATGA